jgi:hypothetical protein
MRNLDRPPLGRGALPALRSSSWGECYVMSRQPCSMQRPPFPQSESWTQSVTGVLLLQWPTQARPLSQWAYSEQTASGPPQVCDTGDHRRAAIAFPRPRDWTRRSIRRRPSRSAPDLTVTRIALRRTPEISGVRRMTLGGIDLEPVGRAGTTRLPVVFGVMSGWSSMSRRYGRLRLGRHVLTLFARTRSSRRRRRARRRRRGPRHPTMLSWSRRRSTARAACRRRRRAG